MHICIYMHEDICISLKEAHLSAYIYAYTYIFVHICIYTCRHLHFSRRGTPFRPRSFLVAGSGVYSCFLPLFCLTCTTNSELKCKLDWYQHEWVGVAIWWVSVEESTHMGWLRLVGSLKLQVSLAEYHLFCRDLLQKRPISLRSLLIVATP